MRNSAPMFSWSFTASSTSTRRAPATSSATEGSSGRSATASTPRWKCTPVTASMASAGIEKIGTSVWSMDATRATCSVATSSDRTS